MSSPIGASVRPSALSPAGMRTAARYQMKATIRPIPAAIRITRAGMPGSDRAMRSLFIDVPKLHPRLPARLHALIRRDIRMISH